MEKAREYHQHIYACFIDLKKAYDSVHRESLWRILQHSYCLPPKLLSFMRALHEDSTAAVRAYGKLSDKFSVTSGARQGCVLAPTLFNFYFDVAICMALEEHCQQGSVIRVAYLLDADLVRNRRIPKLKTLVPDLEYTTTWPFWPTTGLTSLPCWTLSTCCKKLGLTISCTKTKSFAVLPPDDPTTESPVPIQKVSQSK